MPTNEELVAQAYQDILGRTPEAEGLQYWSGQLASGALTPQNIYQNITSAAQGADAANAQRYVENLTRGLNQGTTTNQTLGQTSTTTGALSTQPNATESVSQLYQDLLGRAADEEGLKYWANRFGPTISADERRVFEQAAMPELASNLVNKAYQNIGITIPDQGGLNYWSQQLASGAITPENFNRQFLSAASRVTDSAYAQNAALAQQRLNELNQAYTEETGLLYQGTLGNVTDRDNRTYDTATILNLANQIAPNVGRLSGGIFATRGESVGFGFDEASRILGRQANPVDQVILDMARNLNQMGVTDLRQVQVRPTIGDANVMYQVDESGQPINYYLAGPGYDEGQYYTRNLTPEEVARIETRTVTDPEGGTVTERFIRGVPTAYSLYAADRLLAQSPISSEGLGYQIGSTYSGPGMTGYRVVINPTTGTPQFTTYGADTGQGALISFALTAASFIPGVQPFAQAAGALWAASQGNNIGALASLAGMGGYTNVATALNVANAVDRGDWLSAATSLMSNPTISSSVGNVTLDGNITLRDVGNAANLVNSISTGNVSGMLSSAGALTNSADLNTAAAAVRVIEAIDSGNIAGAVNAARGLDNALNAANNLNNRDVVTNMANSVAEVVNVGTGEETAWGSIYNSAIASGASEQEATDAANLITSTNESSITPINVSSTETTLPGIETQIEGVTQTGPDDFAGFDQAARDTAERTTLNIANDQADSLEEAAALAGARGFTSFNYAGNNYQVSASTAALAGQIASAEIAAQTNFADAYSTAREFLGPGQVFEWNGNQYSTDTREENPSLAAASDQVRAANMGVANGRGTYAGYDEAAVDSALNQLGTFDEFMRATTEGGQSIIVDDKISRDLITPLVRVFGLTTRASGELAESLAGSLVALNVLDRDSPILKAATELKNSSAHAVGSNIAQAERNVFERVSAADGALNKGAELFRAMWDNPITMFTLPFNEGVQEILPLLSGVGAAKWLGTVAGLATSAGLNAAEAAGANYNETVALATRAGMSEDDAHSAGQRSALAAGTVAAVLGPAAEFPFIKRAAGDLASEAVGSTVRRAVGAGAREAVTEYPEEALASIASDYFATGTIDLNKALTQGTIASVTAGKTVGAYSVITDVMADRPATDQILSSGAVTDTQRPVVDQTITTALQNNQNLADAGAQISSSLIESGVSEDQANNIANTVVAEQFLNNIRSEGTEFNIENLNQAVGVDATGNAITVGDLIGSSITNRGNETYITPDVVIGTNANGGVMTLGDLSTVQTVTGSTEAQAETATSGDSTVTTSVDPSTGAETTVDTNAQTNVTTETTTQGNAETTTVTDPNANTATRTETNAETNTQVTTTNDANTNTVTQTTVDPNTTTEVTVNNNTNTTTQVTTDNNTNTQTTVHTDPVNNTQITTVVDGGTGEIIDETITEVPDDWSPPTIDAPPVTTTTLTSTTPRVQQPRRIPPMVATPLMFKETEYISDDDLKFKDPFISSKVGQERFKGSLDPFLAQVEADRLGQEFNQLTQQNMRGGEEMTNYFTYGVPTDIDQVFQTVPSSFENKPSANDEGPTLMAAARGGLATPLMAAGGYAGGGLPVVAHSGKARVDFREGAAVSGPGDGQSDDIPAMLADGEFVFPADVVAALGNGSTKAGSEKLYDMMHSIRAHHRSAKPRDLPPPAKKNPLDYLKKARR